MYACIFISQGLLAWGSPSCDIEIFAPNQPIHPALFWTWGNKHKPLTGTLLAGSVKLFAKELVVMVGKLMPAKTFRELTQPRTFWFFGLVPVRDLILVGVTYTPDWMDSAACSYSLSIIFRAPTARPNLEVRATVLLNSLLDHLLGAPHIVKHPLKL